MNSLSQKGVLREVNETESDEKVAETINYIFFHHFSRPLHLKVLWDFLSLAVPFAI